MNYLQFYCLPFTAYLQVYRNMKTSALKRKLVYFSERLLKPRISGVVMEAAHNAIGLGSIPLREKAAATRLSERLSPPILNPP